MKTRRGTFRGERFSLSSQAVQHYVTSRLRKRQRKEIDLSRAKRVESERFAKGNAREKVEIVPRRMEMEAKADSLLRSGC